MMNKVLKIIAVFLALLSLVLSSVNCTVTASPEKYQETRDMMDTFIQITIYSEDKAVAEKALSAAFDRMEEIAGVASIYDEDSQAFKLNQNGYLDNPALDLVRLIRLSIEYGKISDGYFDITVQPLLELWSGGLWKESQEEQQKIVDETLALIGSGKIDITGERIALQSEGMKITLGAITKGYAVDEALKVLEDIGIEHALIAAAGDISSLGTKPNGEPWNISLVNPDDTTDSLATFTFARKSISTSGNYERYFSPDKKAHHIIDPKTGFSAGGLISVTIIAGSSTQADALATSVFVMGPEAGMRLVESLDDVECFIVDNERIIHVSSGIDKYLSKSE